MTRKYLPCRKCITLAACKNKEHLTCSILTDYLATESDSKQLYRIKAIGKLFNHPNVVIYNSVRVRDSKAFISVYFPQPKKGE